MYDMCVTVFNKGGIRTMAATGLEYTEKYSVIDRTKEARGQVVVEHNNKTVITAPDTFEAVRWYLKIDQGEYTPGKMDDPFEVQSDAEIMAEQDQERMENNKWNYQHLERLYGR